MIAFNVFALLIKRVENRYVTSFLNQRHDKPRISSFIYPKAILMRQDHDALCHLTLQLAIPSKQFTKSKLLRATNPTLKLPQGETIGMCKCAIDRTIPGQWYDCCAPNDNSYYTNEAFRIRFWGNRKEMPDSTSLSFCRMRKRSQGCECHHCVKEKSPFLFTLVR